MQAVLYSKTGQFSGTSFKITGDVTIGKSNTSSVQLRANIISGNHAQITFDDDQKAFYIEDLGSSNGTFLDGIKIKGKEQLERLHVITFAGKFDFIFQVDGVVPHKSQPQAPALTPAKASETTPASVAEKTMIEKSNQGLPSFGKKEEPAGEKTTIDYGQGAPAGLPSFGKKPEPEKPKEDDKNKTVFDSGKDAPAPLPNFGKSQKPPEESKTIIEKPSDSVLPQFPKTPDSKTPSSEEATVAMKPATPNEPPTASPEPVHSQQTKFVVWVDELNKEFQLNNGANTIGRVFGSDIIIEDNSLSRKHASIIVTGDKISITDLGSRNGTFVNKNNINTESEITTDSSIRLGLVEIKIKKVN